MIQTHIYNELSTEPVSSKIGDPIKLGTPVPYFLEIWGPSPQFFGKLGTPVPKFPENWGSLREIRDPL